jgi:hypothetical protein
LSKNLGNRADVSATVNYRTSDFGIDDGNQVKLSDYGVNIYGAQGLTLRFGRTTWANPANGIAIFEKGDGFRFGYKYFSIAQLIRRESDKTAANPVNNDNRSIIFQAKSLPLQRGGSKGVKFLRGLKLLDITALRGEDKGDHVYKTYGGEVFYAYTNLGCGTTPEEFENCSLNPEADRAINPNVKRNWGTISGSVAVFQSTRHTTSPPPDPLPASLPPRSAKGWVGLITATWTPTTQKSTQGGGYEAVNSYTLQYGKGSSDDPTTTGTAENYIGEGGTFAGDTILMSTFASKIDATGHTIIGPSFSNKTFIGLQFVSNKWSLLEYIVNGLGAKDDINSRSTTIRLRRIRFGRPAFTSSDSRDATQEISVDFAIEAPKGVRFNLQGGYMSVGKGVEPVLKQDAWTAMASVSLTI